MSRRHRLGKEKIERGAAGLLDCKRACLCRHHLLQIDGLHAVKLGTWTLLAFQKENKEEVEHERQCRAEHQSSYKRPHSRTRTHTHTHTHISSSGLTIG